MMAKALSGKDKMADREDINIEEKKNCKVQSDCTDEVILSQSRWISNASKKKKGCAYVV